MTTEKERKRSPITRTTDPRNNEEHGCEVEDDDESLKSNNKCNAKDDPHNLVQRFVKNQEEYFSQALSEILQGQKKSHWMWYVLPTPPFIVNGRERGSEMNRFFALRSDDAVIAYLKTKYLRSNYINICEAIKSQLQFGNSMLNLFGSLDQNKAISSWKLFHRVALKVGDTELANLCQNILNLALKPEKNQKKKQKNLFVV